MMMTGAEIVLEALREQKVDTIFGYPGGAVLPIYDTLYKRNDIRHILVRHEQAAVHAAEGYARSTGKVGVVLVTSGPGATNAVTGLTDAMMDSVPLVCLSGQVPTHMIGTDAFQEADTVGITRHCTKHNYLVKDVAKLSSVIHEAFHVASHGRPGPVLVDIPKDVQKASAAYTAVPSKYKYTPTLEPDLERVEEVVRMIARSKRPIFYTGGGVINSGYQASILLNQLVRMTGIPCTSTLMGLGAYRTTDPLFLGMLGMHGTLEANMAMYECDLMIAIGARFDDRVTGDLSKFSPGSKKIHVDIDPSSINKNVSVDIGIVADCTKFLRLLIEVWQERMTNRKPLKEWWDQIEGWRDQKCLSYEQKGAVIKPQYAVERLVAAIESYDYYITTEVGQHQMWAAQYIPFTEPQRWLTSGGLGTMGYGMPAAIGCQLAHPKSLVIDIAGEASIMMNIQEISTAIQYQTPIKVFILNNQYMGMVRQWQELLHDSRYSQSYCDSYPDFVKLAEAFGAVGLRVEEAQRVDQVIHQMITTPGPVIVDVVVDPKENCFPMIPAGKGHNEILLGKNRSPQDSSDEISPVS